MNNYQQPTVLIVDDDKNNVLALEKVLKKESLRVFTAGSGREAVDICRKQTVDVVLTDMRMPGMDGLQLLEALQTISPDSEVVVMTAYGTVESAVEAIKNGAYDFVEKPVKRNTIVKTVKKALEKHFLVVENRNLKRLLKKVEDKQVAGNSAVFRKTLEIAQQAAPSVATILITGESGTGKEVVARYIHENSSRSDQPFIAVNCAALPESILEAELFGYEEGAFTGATKSKDGRFALADGGTIFLDEVAEMTASVQVKLLRALQEREIEPLGGTNKAVDVRVLAATNRDLETEVERGNFREDLFYRLNVIIINMPPLRQRLDDVPLLVDLFINRYAAKNDKPIEGISNEALEILSGYYWPGNVRELENVIERAVVLSRNHILDVADLPSKISTEERYQGQLTISVGTPLEEIELRVIRETLRHTKGDKKMAAQLLGIATRTIYRKLDALN
ncbi:MAG: sigma-54-dependent Fis family transcriptional regulator [Deltaproteobacteria bacterium]|nr:sigma-54-dependent Fis family transcriptional regulator [Deltaproteobacteria bacterium]MBN2672488.1 sigma-54-dependent Fis family transcriptional regulator [Deltaproteobacteria bacterium]